MADSLLAFFSNDETATPWFLTNQTTSAPVAAGGFSLAAAPNPSHAVALSFLAETGQSWSMVIADASAAGARTRIGLGQRSAGPLAVGWL